MGLFSGDNNDKNDQKLLEQVAKQEKSTSLVPNKPEDTGLAVDGYIEGILNASEGKQPNEKTKKLVSDWWNHTTDLYGTLMEQQNVKINDLVNKTYDEAMEVTNDIIGSVLDSLGVPGNFSNPYKIQTMLDNEFPPSLDSAETPATGKNLASLTFQPKSSAEGKTNSLYAFRNPSDTQFAQCLSAKGLGVWDPNGFWRCLFPKTYIKEANLGQNELSKEDVEQDKEHRLGIFFKDYTGYLSWRNHMMNIQSQSSSALSTDMAEPNDNILGRSSSMSYTTDENGKKELTETKIFYKDGTKIVKESKFFPADGSDVVQSKEENFVSKN